MLKIFQQLNLKKPSPYVRIRILNENLKITRIIAYTAIIFDLLLISTRVMTYGTEKPAQFAACVVAAVLAVLSSAAMLLYTKRAITEGEAINPGEVKKCIGFYCDTLLVFAVVGGVDFATLHSNSLVFMVCGVFVFGLLLVPVHQLLIKVLLFFGFYFAGLLWLAPGEIVNVPGHLAFMISLFVVGVFHYKNVRDKYAIEETEAELSKAAEAERWKGADRYYQELLFFESVDDSNMLRRGHFDLTDDKVLKEIGTWKNRSIFADAVTYLEAVEKFPTLADRREDVEALCETTDREKALENFKNGKTSYSLAFPISREHGVISWARFDSHLFESPETGHVEAFFYLRDESRQHIEQLMLGRLVDFGYVALGFVDVNNEMLTAYFYRQGRFDSGRPIRVSFANRGDVFNGIPIGEWEKQEFLRKTELPIIVSSMSDGGKASRLRFDGEAGRQYQAEYCWLDQENKRIFFMVTDITAEVAKERQTRSQFNAMSLAISRTYVALFHIDLVNRRETEIRVDDALYGYTPESVDMDAAISAFEKYDLAPGEAELHGDFWDFDTLPDRLKDKDIISTEVFTKVHGWASINIVVYKRDEMGKVTEVLWMSKEIDEEKKRRLEQQESLRKANEAALQASKAKTRFLSNMSHDIRTPMNAIIGFAGIAAANLDDRERVSDCIEKILLSGNHLHRLINDILDMSHIESGSMTLKETRASLSDMLHDIIPVVQPQFTAKRHAFFINNTSVKDEYVYVDPLKLNQVLINLLGNAIKFTPIGGTIRLIVEEYESERAGCAGYRFIVKDSGIGMSEDFQKRIFEPFERESTSTVSKIEGTGLGLTIAKNIIDMMGGTVSVKSEAGVGTEFTVDVVLRLCEDMLDVTYDERLRNKRALIMCEFASTCGCLTESLKRLGMYGDNAPTVEEAVMMTASEKDDGTPYDFLIIDWSNPNANICETIERLRAAAGREAGIAAVTVYDWSSIAKSARNAGLDTFISKPVFTSDLERGLLASMGESEVVVNSNDHNADVRTNETRLLVVEDNELNREIAIAVLENAGFIVETANDGSEAIEKIKDSEPGRYNVILMDIQMPVMDGYEATREIRRLDRPDAATIPIIAMTANAFEEDKRRAASCGMNDHIAKPIEVDLLISTISKYL